MLIDEGFIYNVLEFQHQARPRSVSLGKKQGLATFLLCLPATHMFSSAVEEGRAGEGAAGGQREAAGGTPDTDAGRRQGAGGDMFISLFQTKTGLDMEISLYRSLLESEEDRLGEEQEPLLVARREQEVRQDRRASTQTVL